MSPNQRQIEQLRAWAVVAASNKLCCARQRRYSTSSPVSTGMGKPGNVSFVWIAGLEKKPRFKKLLGFVFFSGFYGFLGSLYEDRTRKYDPNLANCLSKHRVLLETNLQ